MNLYQGAFGLQKTVFIFLENVFKKQSCVSIFIFLRKVQKTRLVETGGVFIFHFQKLENVFENRKQKTENKKPSKMSFLICIQVWKTKNFHFPRKLWKTDVTKRVFYFSIFLRKLILKNGKFSITKRSINIQNF